MALFITYYGPKIAEHLIIKFKNLISKKSLDILQGVLVQT